MASFRCRLFPFGSPLSLQSTKVGHSGLDEGFRRNILRKFSSIVTTEQRVLKLEVDEGNQNLEDEIAKIQHVLNSLKERFLKIPVALQGIPKTDPKGIYVNKNVRLDNIQVYGFDYDYTLAHYSANLQSLIYDLAKEYLVNELRYPDSCLEFKYDNSFPIRGLYYDKSKGCLIKLDFFGSIEPEGCYFGRRKLSRSEIDDLYGTRHIGRDQARGLVGLMDFFCFSEHNLS
ncbi:5'-nucleotidase domain-containing protein ddb_g0275467 [Phtheirospermum japonicum]|uniref:5'-nucleotidase domain-containing protein ddb_g0275467 n=1 Tax=Phtheirospermum japonicum TaxID=374723 RepID=A0A830BTR3_9LAMI|nr:5'-nucleotidase domain-containing protein ddb_g0275467 [Phtheirospermum japonicum]